MSDDTTRFLVMLANATDYEPTVEEAVQELNEEGVDIAAFLVRVQAVVNEAKTNERLSWRKDSQRNKDSFTQTNTPQLASKFGDMSRAELVANAQRHASQLHFKNFETATDDDLRTLLIDQATLEALSEKK